MDTAIEEALDKRNIEIAINALKEGIEKKTISKLTGLSIEEIENLM